MIKALLIVSAIITAIIGLIITNKDLALGFMEFVNYGSLFGALFLINDQISKLRK